MTQAYDVVVIGGGASGMTAAILTARDGLRVALLEHNDIVGKKILATGNGKCNFTNSYQGEDCYRGTRPQTAMELLERFGVDDILSFFASLGIPAKQRGGYWYPYSEQASSVREAFELELNRSGVSVFTNCHADDVLCEPADGDVRYRIECRKRDRIPSAPHTQKKAKNKSGKKQADKPELGEEYALSLWAENVVLAGGGVAGNISGADGSCYRIAEKLGIRIVTPVPALVQLKTAENYKKELAGVRFPARARLCIHADKIREEACYEETGEFLFTDYGVSGIPAMQLSRYASVKINRGGNPPEIDLLLDFFPDTEENELCSLLKARINKYPERTFSEVLNGLLPGKLNISLLGMAAFSPQARAGEVKDADAVARRLGALMKRMKWSVTGTNPMENAQVSAGGIHMDELKPDTMELYRCSGVYAVGELADMDGTCGGYNLQWAWMSAMAAAEDIQGRMQKKEKRKPLIN